MFNMRSTSGLIALAALALPVVSLAQALDTVKGDYWLHADASAGVVFDSHNNNSSSTADNHTAGISAIANDNIDDVGSATASGYASATWSTTYGPGHQTLTAQALCTASSGDFGLSAGATGASKLELYFDIAYDTSATATFFDSPFGIPVTTLERFSGGSWVLVTSSSVGVWSGPITMGSYRWVADQVAPASGNESNSATSDFSIDVLDPVPEPASMAVLGLGALALLRRRR